MKQIIKQSVSVDRRFIVKSEPHIDIFVCNLLFLTKGEMYSASVKQGPYPLKMFEL